MAAFYAKFAVINATTGGAVVWLNKRAAAESRARSETRLNGGTYIVAKVISYTSVVMVENK